MAIDVLAMKSTLSHMEKTPTKFLFLFPLCVLFSLVVTLAGDCSKHTWAQSIHLCWGEEVHTWRN